MVVKLMLSQDIESLSKFVIVRTVKKHIFSKLIPSVHGSDHVLCFSPKHFTLVFLCDSLHFLKFKNLAGLRNWTP